MTVLKFRSANDILEQASVGGGILDAQLMSEVQREQLCRDLLTEFGATNIATRGDELWCSCVMPDHYDRRPSASLNYRKLTYKCFSCGSGGGLIWFVAICRGDTEYQARHWISNHTGASGDALVDLLTMFDMLYAPETDRRPPIPVMNPRVLDPWMFIHPWVTEKRKVPEQAVIDFKVGWNPDTNRIVIPHVWKGDLVGWQTRRLANDGTPKYLSSPDFPRERTVYNYDIRQEVAVVVEAPFSVLRHNHQAHMVATFGSAVTERQIRLLAHYPLVISWMDNDESGWKATKVLAEGLGPYTEVRVVDSPWAADPADVDDDTFESLISLDSVLLSALWKPPKELVEWPSV